MVWGNTCYTKLLFHNNVSSKKRLALKKYENIMCTKHENNVKRIIKCYRKIKQPIWS